MKPKIVVIGDVNIDWVVSVESTEAPINSLWIESPSCISACSGGSAAVFAKAAQNTGFDAHLVARIGADVLGAALIEELRLSGVHLHVSRDANCETGKVIIINDHNDRRAAMISHRGANVNLCPADVPDDVLPDADAVYMSGYALLQRPQSIAALELAQRARKEAIPVIIDVVPHRVVRESLPSDYSACLALASGVIIELGTARRLLGMANETQDDVISTLRSRFDFIVLSPNNETCWVADRSGLIERATGYAEAKHKAGFLDSLVAGLLYEYLKKVT